jgi:hypothetical protein
LLAPPLDITGLSELTNMKELKLGRFFDQGLTVEQADALVSSIEMLRDLRHLSLECMIKCDGY